METETRAVLEHLKDWSEGILATGAKRLRNQADFYSLFGSVLQLVRAGNVPAKTTALKLLSDFMTKVNAEDERQQDADAKRYFEAARSASNDVAQRKDRVQILLRVLAGEKAVA